MSAQNQQVPAAPATPSRRIRPQPWQRTEKGRFSDFKIGDIRTELECTETEWTAIEHDVYTLSSQALTCR